MLTATSSGNGNMLMNRGPKWEGAFETQQVKRLEKKPLFCPLRLQNSKIN